MPPITRKRKRQQELEEEGEEENAHGPKEPRSPSAITLPTSTTPVAFNSLCSLCKSLLSKASIGSKSKERRFYSYAALVQSATKYCHLCTLLLDALHKEGSLPDNVRGSTQLTVETRYYKNLGISVLIFNKGAKRHDHGTYVDLTFRDTHKMKTLLPVISTHTQSRESWRQVERWINQCKDQHVSCQADNKVTGTGEYPTRILDVESSNNGVRLCETSTLKCSTLKYVTLSHCWGGVIPTRLLSENYGLFSKRIIWSLLPKTFQHAIEITRKLGIRYLWIDSLCIIQDDSADWQREAGRMHQVYKHSYITLAAAASPDSQCGLFHQRSPLSIVPCTAETGHGAHRKHVTSSYRSELQAHPDSELILLSRAWALQEWILSPRILVFGKRELHWVCKELVGSEAIPTMPEYSDDTKFVSLDDIPWVSLRRNWDNTDKESHHRGLKTWHRIVSSYSAMKLTSFSDKLIAVSGLASDLSSSWGGVTYLAGLWSHRLRRDLLWRTEKPELRPQYSYTAPSWSWASLDSPVIPAHDYEASDYLVEVISSNTQLVTSLNPHGAVTSGFIQLKGPMIRTTVTQVSGDKWRISLFSESPESPETPEFELQASVVAWIYWDDKRVHELLRGAYVTLVPFEINSSHSSLELQGLVLEPTYARDGQGQYRRLGYFKISDSWVKNKFDSNQALRKIFDSENVSEDGNASNSSTDTDITSPVAEARRLTALELETMFEMLRDEEDELSTDPTQLENKLVLNQKQIRHSTQRAGDTPGDGEIDMTLMDRYKDELSSENYPNINSFLSVIHIRFDIEEEEWASRPQLYQACHGQGYFAFEIV